jgi:hypothetical protein
LLHQCNDTSGGLVEAFDYMHGHALNNRGWLTKVTDNNLL